MQTLIVGTYGLSKSKGETSGYNIVDQSLALSILKKAWKLNIKYLDTAPGYGDGNADILIIKARKYGCKFKLNSKVGLNIELNQFYSNSLYLKKEIEKINSIHSKYLNAVFLHSPTEEFLNKDGSLLEFYNNVKSICGVNVKVGISLRSPEDFLLIRDFKHSLLIETNLSWFDLRILDYLFNEKKHKHFLIARSIYASGLINLIYQQSIGIKNEFEKIDIRSKWDIDFLFNRNQQDVERVEYISKIMSGESISEIALSLFPMISCFVQGLILGPLTVEELENSIYNIEKISKKTPKDELAQLLSKYLIN